VGINEGNCDFEGEKDRLGMDDEDFEGRLEGKIVNGKVDGAEEG